MQKFVRGHRFLLLLPALLFFVLGLVGGTHTAYAAEHSVGNVEDDCTGAYHKPFFNSTVVVNSGEVICSNLTSFGGTEVIRGEVTGNVVVFGGNVVIDGTVRGNVILYGGNVTLQDGAHIDRDIHLCNSHWLHGVDSQLRGSVIDCTSGTGLLILSSKRTPEFSLWALVTWIALGLLLTSLLPEHVMLVRATAKSKLRRSLVLGLLSVLLAPVVLLVTMALIISIPLAIIIMIGLIAAWALGTVAVGWLIGEFLLRTFAPQYNTRALQVVVGLTILTLAGSLPFVGPLVSIITGLLGLGAVFLSRFGTRLYSQPKHPLPL